MSERSELDHVAGGSLRGVIRGLVDSVDPETQASAVERAERDGTSPVDPARLIADLIECAIEPLAANPELRSRILELRRAHDQVIDEVTVDELVDAYGVVDTSRARSIVDSWRAYLAEHRSEISAIQVLMEARTRRVPFAAISELADRIARPPHNWTVDLIWHAYEALQIERVKPNDHARLTDLVSLLRYELGEDAELVPYADVVRTRYDDWLGRQGIAGVAFTDDQRWWLDRMADVIANSAGLSDADLDGAPFTERGGVDGAVRDLGDRAGALIAELNTELTA